MKTTTTTGTNSEAPKHTQGPWKVTGSNTIVAISGNYPGGKFDMVRIAICPDSVIGDANAQLIAAAPDLLAACRSVMDLWGDIDGIDYDKIRAAIARTEGSA